MGYSLSVPSMKNAPIFPGAGLPFLVAGLFTLASQTTHAALSDGLVSYWPMEDVAGGKTPDLVNGYDMTLNNLTAADLVGGKVGKCFSFANSKQTLLSRIHGAADDLPANKHPAFTVAFWANVVGTGQADLRLFSEGFTPNNNTPLFNLGTHTSAANGALDVFIRNAQEAGTHQQTTQTPFDGTWHHVVFVQAADDTRRVYIDGVLDDLAVLPRIPGPFPLNDTTIGGILRASPSHWVTGLIDEVAIWKRDLSDAEITQVKTDGLAPLFPPEAKGLVAHYPMEDVAGGKTPDLVNGYDMSLNNLTAADLVTGKVGKCFSFANSKQTLLSRIHGPADDLPANKHSAFTVTFWANVVGTGQADLRLFSEGFTPNNNTPLFNLGTHTSAANGALDVFIRNAQEAGTHQQTTQTPFDGTWHHVAFVQYADNTRKVFIDGVEDDLAVLPRIPGPFPLNDTTIGGILRASPSHWVTGLIDEVAIWKRDLSETEIGNVKANGVPKVFTKKLPLELKSFTSDFPTTANGDKVVLRWEGSKDANYSISPGVGDVTAQTASGTGSKEVTVSGSTTYTLTASRGSETLTKQVSVAGLAGVASGWHVLDTFETLNPGPLAGQSIWLGAEGVFNVVDLNGNKAIGFTDGNALTAVKLNSYKIPEGQKGTVSFKVYVTPLAAEDPITALGTHAGVTERSIRFNGDFGSNVGPYVRVERLVDGSTVDLLARNGVATGTYEGQAVDALQPGKWYRIWIDTDNKPFDVVDGVQTGGDHYSVYIQKDGDASRTALFTDYVADRDAVTVDPALGAPTKDLLYVFISAIGASQGNNLLLFDDFFVSVGAFNSTVPFVPVTGPTQINITSSGYNAATGKFTLTFGSLTGVSYTIQRKTDLGAATWTSIATGFPTGGATGASTSFEDATGGAGPGFYRVVYVP